jgi:hypothetical protein
MKSLSNAQSYDGWSHRGMPKDFNKDSEWRLGEMQKELEVLIKKTFNTQAEFIQKFKRKSN